MSYLWSLWDRWMERTERSRVLRVSTVALIVVACLAGVAALTLAGGAEKQAQDAKDLVRIYCNGAVSEAQYQGCIHHVTKTQIDRLANEGDQTAINAENAICDPGNAIQEGDC